jgi:hypothetical protein
MTAAHAYGQWVLALDLGANTLDLALFADEDGRHKAKAWDSVMLGGNLVADALVVRTKTNERWLRWELSEGRLQADKDLIQDADLLLRLSMEYAARFVAGSLLQLPEVGSGDPIPLRVVLLGSGWRWYQFVSQQRKRFDEKGFDERFGAYLAKRIDALGGEPLRGRVTVAISAGLLVSGEGRCQEDSRGWCCSVAYGAWSAAGHEALAVAQGLARMAPGLVEPKPGIEAPNGLCESGRPWTQMVGKNHPLGRPKSVSADPSFDDDLERIAPLQRLAHGATNMEVLYELARCTEVDQTRTRTALGLAFEALSAQWFGLDRKQEGTPEPVAVPADKNG